MTDLVLSGGRVLGVDDPDGVVVVRDGTILAVGGPETRELAGPGAATVDLQGGLLVPGFTDAHAHPIQGGIERRTCDLTGRRARRRTSSGSAPTPTARPELEWIVGAGWEMAAFPGGTPTAASLDAAVGDRPVVPRQPRPPRRLGQLPRAGAGRHRRARRRTPRAGGSSATPTAARPAPCTRARWHLVERLVPKPGPAERWPACWRPSATCTPSGSPAGRTPSSAPTTRCPTPGPPTGRRCCDGDPHRPGGGCALVGRVAWTTSPRR